MPHKFAGWLTVNRSCNLRCRWCYAKALGFLGSENMSLEVVRRAISLFKGLPLERVILIGGEPTIHPDFFKIISLVREAELEPVLVTNSLKFKNKGFLKETLGAGIKGITTSLKGYSDDQYGVFTGRRVFGDVMEAIHNINESEAYHKISVTVCESLFDDFEKMIEAIVKSGVQSFSLDMERPILIGNRTQSPGSSSPKEMADFFVRIYPLLDNCGVRFAVKISIPFCLFPLGFIEKMVEKDQIIAGCQIFGGSGVIIDQRGRLLPCNHFCDNPLGELGIDFTTAEEYLSFREGRETREFYETIASYPHQKCAGCEQWKYCGAGCRIHWLHREANELLCIP